VNDRTVGEVLQASARWLQERGGESPRVDSQVLLAHVLGVSRMELLVQMDRPLSEPERAPLRDLLRRRAQGEPVAYLLGRRGFWSLELEVTPAVLIPRPETETLVEAVVRGFAGRRTEPLRVVDVGTGSGAIGLALAMEFPAAQVVGMDVSADALEVARRNATACGLGDRFHTVRGDLLEPLLRRGSRVDLVVSNPPYVANGDTTHLADSVRRWEPHLALFGGEDGLDVYRRLIPQAAEVLEGQGVLAMECGIHQADVLRTMVGEHFAHTGALRDLGGIPRVVLGSKSVPVEGWRVVEGPPAEVQERADAGGMGVPHEQAAPGLEPASAVQQGAAGADAPMPVIDLNDL
jgi:release factor glutamine methyltransferase